jgi:hypothetical protein
MHHVCSEALVHINFVSFISNRNISCNLSAFTGTCSLSTHCNSSERKGFLKSSNGMERVTFSMWYIQYNYSFRTAAWECLSLGGTCDSERKVPTYVCHCESINWSSVVRCINKALKSTMRHSDQYDFTDTGVYYFAWQSI